MAEPPVAPPPVPPPQLVQQQESGKVYARNRATGEIVTVTPEDYAAYADTYAPVERTEVEATVVPARAQQILRDNVDEWDAAGKGLERAFTLGMSDMPEFHSPDYGEYLKALEDEHPLVLHGTELAATVAQAAMGVGLPGAADKLGRAVKGAIEGETVASRLLAGAAGGAAEGAFYGPGAAALQATMDHKQTADLIWSDTGGMMAVGALLGGPLALLGRKGVGQKALSEAEQALKPGADLDGPGMAAMVEARWKDGADPGLVNKLRSIVGGGSPEVYAALERDPELRRYLTKEAADAWYDENARLLARDMTPTAQALESAQVHTGSLKYENAIPHLDPIIAGRAVNKAEQQFDELEQMVVGRLNDKAYNEALQLEVNAVKDRGPIDIVRLPHDAHTPSRMVPIREAYEKGLQDSLPPIKVAKNADGSLGLIDGNHRLAVARERGEKDIAAHVRFYDEQGNVVREWTGKLPLQDDYLNPSRKVFALRNRMDDTVEAMRASEVDEEIMRARLQKKEADFTRLAEDLAKQEATAGRSAVRQQMEARLRILNGEQKKLREQIALLKPVRSKMETEFQLLQRELDDLGKAGVEIRPAKMEGHTELKRFLGKIRSSRARVLAEEDTVTQAARAFAELDSLKSAAGQAAMPGKVLSRWDDVPEAFRRINDTLRRNLEDGGTWGARLAEMQAKVNAPYHRQLNVLREVAGKYLVRSGDDSAFTTWKQGEMADPAGFMGLLSNMSSATSDVELAKLRQYLESSVDVSRALRAHYPNMAEVELKRFADAEKAAQNMLGNLDRISREASKINQIRFVSRQPDEAQRQIRIGATLFGGMFGGPLGAGAGWLAGQKVMNVLNPVPRLTMLARAEQLKGIHDTWQMRLVHRLLGGKSVGRPPKVPGTPKPTTRAYVKLKTPITKQLLYTWMQQPEDKGDKQKSAERFVDRMRVAADGQNGAAVTKSIEEMLGSYGEMNPDVKAVTFEKARAAARAIVRNAPAQVAPSDTMWPQLWDGAKWSREQFQTLEDAVEAAFDPKTSLEKVESGMVTPEQIKIIEESSPELLAMLRQGLVEAALSSNPPSKARRVQLSIVLGVPTDPTNDPEYVGAMQQLYTYRIQAAEEAKKKASGRTFGPTGQNVGSSVSTSLSRLEKGEHPK